MLPNWNNNGKNQPGLANYKSPDIFPKGSGTGGTGLQTPNLKLTPSNQYGAPPAPGNQGLAGNIPKGPTPTLVAGKAPTPLRTVQPQETVQHQLTGLLGTNSPYMRHARLRGFQHANSRGLLNSSLAAQAAEQAAIERGLPIAQQDADTFNQAALANQKTMLDTNLANLQTATQVGTANLDTQNQRYLAHLDSDTRFGLQKLDSQTKINLALLDQNTKLKVEALAGKYRNLLDTSKAATDAFREVTNNIASILGSKELNDKGKENAVNYQLRALQHHNDQLEHIAKTDPTNIGNLNLKDFFNFGKNDKRARPGNEQTNNAPQTFAGFTQAEYAQLITDTEQEWNNSTYEIPGQPDGYGGYYPGRTVTGIKGFSNYNEYFQHRLREEIKKRQPKT